MLLTLLILTTFALICKGDLPPPLPPSTKVKFTSIAGSGTGCPANSFSVNYNIQKTAFTVLFDSFIASIPSSGSVVDAKKSCLLTLAMSIPAGYQFRLTTVDYRGYASVQSGIDGNQQSKYKFLSDVYWMQGVKPLVIKGPSANSYTYRDKLGLTELWSMCSGYDPRYPDAVVASNLQIDTSVSTTKNLDYKTGAAGMMTADSMDGVYKVSHRYGISWRICYSVTEFSVSDGNTKVIRKNGNFEVNNVVVGTGGKWITYTKYIVYVPSWGSWWMGEAIAGVNSGLMTNSGMKTEADARAAKGIKLENFVPL